MLDIPPVDWAGIQRNVRVALDNRPRIDWAMMKRLHDEIAQQRPREADLNQAFIDDLLDEPMLFRENQPRGEW